jgi:hypothetical protein
MASRFLTTDCDDSDSAISPAESESDNSVDDDCDDTVDKGYRSPGDLIITEVMVNPNGAEPDNEWIEIYNTTGTDIVADGLLFESDCAAMQYYYVGRDGLVVGASDYAVLCFDDATLGSNCDYVYGRDVNGSSVAGVTFDTGFCLANSAFDLTISHGATLLDDISYVSGAAAWPSSVGGASLVLDGGAYSDSDNDDGANWCYPSSDEEYDIVDGNYGTPNALGSCEGSPP